MSFQISQGPQVLCDNNVERKKAVPKFTSFQRKSTQAVQRLPPAAPNDNYVEDTPARSRSERSDRKQTTNFGEDPNAAHRCADSTHIFDANTSHLFAVDRKGDAQIPIFGTLHKYAIPPYYRFGHRRVVGLSNHHAIGGAISDQRTLVLTHTRQQVPSRVNRQAIWKHSQSNAPVVTIRPQRSITPTSHDIIPDYIPLDSIEPIRADHESSLRSPESSDEDGNHYEVKGTTTTRKDLDRRDRNNIDVAIPEHEDVEFAVAHVEAQQRRSELSRKVDKDPANAMAWLDLIAYQGSSSHNDSSSGRNNLTEAQSRSNAEVKLSIYQKALKSVVDPQGREALLLGEMEEGSQVWSLGISSSRWQGTIHSSPRSGRLWSRYLGFKQTSFASFRSEDVRSVYYECFNHLRYGDETMKCTFKKSEEPCAYQIYIFLRATLFLRDSGFVESAIAAWQAFLEHTFFNPGFLRDVERRDSDLHTHKVPSNFEDFWDSEVPRIGEEGWVSWASYSQGQSNVPTHKSANMEGLDQTQELWPSWVQSENKQNLVAREPARTIDDAVEDDPYRVILYSDIQPFLLETAPDMNISIILDAILAFCHLPPLSVDVASGSTKFWWRDGYVQHPVPFTTSKTKRSYRHHPDSSDPPLHKSGPAVDKYYDDTTSRSNPFDLPILDYQLSSDTLMSASGAWFSAFDVWLLQYKDDKGPVKKAWVLQLLKSLVFAGIGGPQFAEYVLALELQVHPGGAKATAKSLLRKQSSNLLLYNAYALIECRLGNFEKGEGAMVAAINLSRKLDATMSSTSILLWRNWAWELLWRGKNTEALVRLCQYGGEDDLSTVQSRGAAEGQEIRPALVLRATRALAATRDHAISSKSFGPASFAAECLVLIEYLRHSQSLPAAATTFKSSIETIFGQHPEKSLHSELLHQSFARLLYHHVKHTRLVKPADIRVPLAENISLFPHNTIFLSLYAWNEAQFKLDDRVRSVVRTVLSSESKSSDPGERQDNVILHFFAIHTEFNRSTISGGNASTIRSTFERAVADKCGAHCPGLWKWYFLYEYNQGDLIAAKNVYWRAVKACPWVKAIYMLAFTHLGGEGGFGSDELRSIYELMSEKELRIHAKLDDVFDEIDEREAIK